ncbi:pantetheine-phosphate adenylyltransferase [Alicyclobacillus sp. ALC3]|uniref:pantetheine-phosphate adenylyltransferase n=1 Tax=Alicyclobacillus sp. ALC3 TaxID=2796143 RepID=UPI002379D571|nr:pantetheine-phosphate adenylyltransferase [Alicyclobacillus sp. ALC3]WDL97398.1 pantetheine-phosphate adenylyltransferase [Alicyclobacillus sp. ALC3]
MRKAVYPGSFDPITNGHLDIVERASLLFDEVTVAVLTNPAKRPLLTLETRVRLIQEATAHLRNIQVDSFSGLLMDYAKRIGARAVVRGIRGVQDFDMEVNMAHMNRQLDEEVTTVFLAAKAEYSYISSSLVKDIAWHGGDMTRFVPDCVVVAVQSAVANH